MPISLDEFVLESNTAQPQRSEPVGKPGAVSMDDFVGMTKEPSMEVEEPIVDVPEEQVAQWEGQGEIGYIEQLRRSNKLEMLPGVGAFKDVQMLLAFKRAQKGQYETPDQEEADRELINNYISKAEEERVRGFSMGGNVARGHLALPKYMLEFALTGGLATTARFAARRGVATVLAKAVKDQSRRIAARKILGGVTGLAASAGVRTTVLPQTTIENYAERQINSGLMLTDKGLKLADEIAEKPYTSFAKAIGDTYIEYFSEETGGIITKGIGKFIPKQFKTGLERIYKKMNPNETINKLWTRAGYSNFIGELGEEQLGDFLRAITGVEDFGAENPESIFDRLTSSFHDAETLMTNSLVLALPGGVKATAGQTIELIQKRKQDSGVIDIPLNEIDDAEATRIAGDKAAKPEEARTPGAEIQEEAPKEPSIEDTQEIEPLVEPGETIEGQQEGEAVVSEEEVAAAQEQATEPEAPELAQEEGEVDISPVQLEAIQKAVVEELAVFGGDPTEGVQIPASTILNEARRLRDEAIKSGEIEGAQIKDFESEAEEIARFVRRGFRRVQKDLGKQIREVTGISTAEKPTVTKSRALKESLRAEARGARVGFRAGRKAGREEVKSAKEILDARRARIRNIQTASGLTDLDIKKVTRKDIRLMNNYEFAKFVRDVEARAAEFKQKKELKQRIANTIREKELVNEQNLRQFLKFPALKDMSVEQLNQFNQELEKAQKGDEFLSVRKLETVKNTELIGVRTVREAKEKLADRLGVDLEQVNKIDVSPLDKFLYDTALARRNPFYQFLVDETNAALLDGEQRFFEMEREVDALTRKARRSRDRSLIDRLIPTDEIVFEWLESENKNEIAKSMTKEELELASYLQSRFAEFRDYLIQHETLDKYQSNYISHIRRGFLETWKEDGLLNAFKEVFRQYVEDEAVFKILEDDTENILPLEKFFRFAMRRSGNLKPSQNVAAAFKAYTKALTKKQSLDKIVPALDIYAYSLAPKERTERGLQVNRRIIKFVREWINNKKGRRSSLGGILPQNGAVDIGLRATDGFITLLDLGLNIPVGITVQIGEQVTSFINLGSKQYALGIARSLTKKGRKILKDNQDFIGKSPWEDLSNTADNIGDKFTKGLYFLFSTASVNANSIHLLGSMNQKEWKEGKISSERKAILLREAGRFRGIQGAKSIFGSTAGGKVLTKYKTWALPILNTIIADIATLGKMTRKGQFREAIKSREFNELFRATLITSLFVLAARGMVDDDDDSFIGETLKKAYRESLTVLGAIDPTVLSSVRLASFLADLSQGLKQIVLLEQYRTKKGFKGVKKLKGVLTPRALKTLTKDK